MSDEFEPTVQYTAADDWASDDAKRSMTHSQQAQDISDSVAIYLALGGKITEVAPGVSAVYDPTMASVPFCQDSPTPKHQVRGRDADMTNKVKHYTTMNPDITFKELVDAMHVRSAVLVRVLKIYFKDDPVGSRIHKDYVDKTLAGQHLDAAARQNELTKRRDTAMRDAAALFLKQVPGANLNQIAVAISASVPYVRKILGTGFDGDTHVQWLLKDHRKRENKEPA